MSPADYIFESMIAPPKSTPQTAEGVGRGRHGSNGGGGPVMSMDLGFLSSGDVDVELDGGLATIGVRVKSADFVEDVLLPDGPDSAGVAPAVHTAAGSRRPTACVADEPSGASGERRRNEEEQDDFCPVVRLSTDLGRMSTGDEFDEFDPLRETFRITSRDWIKDFEGETTGDLGVMHPSLFMDNGARRNSGQSSILRPQLNPLASNYEEYQMPLKPPASCYEEHQTSPRQGAPGRTRNGDCDAEAGQAFQYKRDAVAREGGSAPVPVPQLSNSSIRLNRPIPDTPTAPPEKTSPKSSSSSGTSKKKKRKKRLIDESRSFTPTENDVLFGRGGKTNSHPGNIKFRERALALRPWYEQPSTSKEEKYRISDLLVESVRSEGHRFLEKGADGLWHEVIGNGARRKASQALRERIRGTRARAGGSGGGVGSAGSEGGGSLSVEEAIGDLMPTSVEDMVGDAVGI